MNTQITAASVEAKLRETITAQCGGKVITMSEGALTQMKQTADMIVEKSGFNIDTLSETDLFAANVFANLFTKANINGNVVDGVIQPADAVALEADLIAVQQHIGMFTPGAVLPIYLVAKIMGEVKQFTR